MHITYELVTLLHLLADIVLIRHTHKRLTHVVTASAIFHT